MVITDAKKPVEERYLSSTQRGSYSLLKGQDAFKLGIIHRYCVNNKYMANLKYSICKLKHVYFVSKHEQYESHQVFFQEPSNSPPYSEGSLELGISFRSSSYEEDTKVTLLCIALGAINRIDFSNPRINRFAFTM
mmetsp:Transcript_9552/g.12393  ORF Transcript_9552/g.12393 Transcript_9552/m.12393 type:complete len:135 (-) Transcript_9552:808-1212(-)